MEDPTERHFLFALQRSARTERNIPTDKYTTPGRPSIPNHGWKGWHHERERERTVSTLSRQNQCDLKPSTSPLPSISSTPFARARSSRVSCVRVCFHYIRTHACIRIKIWKFSALKNAEINIFDFQFTKSVLDDPIFSTHYSTDNLSKSGSRGFILSFNKQQWIFLSHHATSRILSL